MIYRFLSGDWGIFEAAAIDCPPNSPHREAKPDDSWFEMVGKDYPSAVSYWTEKGLKLYCSSGLQEWHLKVVEEEVNVVIAEMPSSVLYKDDFQVICNPIKGAQSVSFDQLKEMLS